jgi:hypothetical protein
MKTNHPSISTNRAVTWYHHCLTLATHSQRDKEIRDILEGYT